MLGSIEQQLVNNGEVPLAGLNSSGIALGYSGGQHFCECVASADGGRICSAHAAVLRRREFWVDASGVHGELQLSAYAEGPDVLWRAMDNARSRGTTRAGFSRQRRYNRYMGKWEINGFALYNQNVQTLLVMYTTSTLNYGGTIKRETHSGSALGAVANVIHSVFEQTAGTAATARALPPC